MRILVACQTMTSISGSPMYNFTLALELHRRGHSVAVYSMFEDNELQSELVKRKIMTCYSVPSGRFDLALISQPDNASLVEEIAADKIINIVHSEYDCESPIISKKIDHYIAIRKSIKDHLISEHNIPEDNISIIYNGIDSNRFSKNKRKANDEDYIKVVIPCTLDQLRKNFIEYYTKKASDKFRVFLYGTDYGMDFYKNEFVSVNPAVFNIEEKIKDADLVAGILLGRVNLEARAMGIVSTIHNPERPEDFSYFFPVWEDFEKEHDIKNVVDKLLSL